MSPRAAASGAALFLALMLTSCATEDAVDLPETHVAAVPSPSAQLMRLRDERILESSGLARSSMHLGVLYTHNDKGNPPEVYAVSPAGTRAVLRFFGAPSGDWEDIATTTDGRIWVGDIGDRDAIRKSIAILVAREPNPLITRDVEWTRYQLKYPDGAHNAEGLMVHPETGEVFVVTKEREGGGIYAAPKQLSATSLNRLSRVADAPANVTAADFAPDGGSFALRNYRAVYLYSGFATKRQSAPLPRQAQGESLTFTSDGSGLLVGSEGANSSVLRVPLPPAASDSDQAGAGSSSDG